MRNTSFWLRGSILGVLVVAALIFFLALPARFSREQRGPFFKLKGEIVDQSGAVVRDALVEMELDAPEQYKTAEKSYAGVLRRAKSKKPLFAYRVVSIKAGKNFIVGGEGKIVHARPGKGQYYLKLEKVPAGARGKLTSLAPIKIKKLSKSLTCTLDGKSVYCDSATCTSMRERKNFSSKDCGEDTDGGGVPDIIESHLNKTVKKRKVFDVRDPTDDKAALELLNGPVSPENLDVRDVASTPCKSSQSAEGEKCTMILYGASWCGPCRTLKKELEERGIIALDKGGHPRKGSSGLCYSFEYKDCSERGSCPSSVKGLPTCDLKNTVTGKSNRVVGPDSGTIINFLTDNCRCSNKHCACAKGGGGSCFDDKVLDDANTANRGPECSTGAECEDWGKTNCTTTTTTTTTTTLSTTTTLRPTTTTRTTTTTLRPTTTTRTTTTTLRPTTTTRTTTTTLRPTTTTSSTTTTFKPPTPTTRTTTTTLRPTTTTRTTTTTLRPTTTTRTTTTTLRPTTTTRTTTTTLRPTTTTRTTTTTLRPTTTTRTTTTTLRPTTTTTTSVTNPCGVPADCAHEASAPFTCSSGYQAIRVDCTSRKAIACKDSNCSCRKVQVGSSYQWRVQCGCWECVATTTTTTTTRTTTTRTTTTTLKPTTTTTTSSTTTTTSATNPCGVPADCAHEASAPFTCPSGYHAIRVDCTSRKAIACKDSNCSCREVQVGSSYKWRVQCGCWECVATTTTTTIRPTTSTLPSSPTPSPA